MCKGISCVVKFSTTDYTQESQCECAGGVVAVKCLYSARRHKICPETVPYLHFDEHTGLDTLDLSYNYYYQIQGLVYNTSKSDCCFIVNTLCDCYEVLQFCRQI